MEREYNGTIRDDVKFFTGIEVEKTLAFGKKTLFVSGMLDPNEVVEIAINKGIDHVYLGANQSFWLDDKDASGVATPEQFRGWNALFTVLREAGIWITLDYDIKYHSWVLEQGFNEYNKFISMISVKLPHVDALNYNACLKIDDTDFEATNTGVWVHPVHNLKDPSKYTDWSKYKNDKGI
jgi:hypothetical protein